MSMSGFRGSNHPQQIGRRGARDEVDDRGTDLADFARFDERFAFDLDVAAAPHNAKCSRYFTRDSNGLVHGCGATRHTRIAGHGWRRPGMNGACLIAPS